MKRLLSCWMLLSGVALLMGCQAPSPTPMRTSSSTSSNPPTNSEPPAQKKPIPIYTYRIVKTYPHDPKAFTQGLVYADGFLYEGTGLEGQSSLRKVELRTGRVLQIKKLAPELFGEGITLWQDKIYQLTWRNGICFVYERDSFRSITEFRYTGEGWGLTHDGKHLIMSDGSDTLTFRDPDTFAIVKRLQVKADGVPVRNLNELEYVEGEIYANVWQTDMIARISPATGEVVGWIDLSGLLSEREARNADVLNGIAYDPKGKRLFVTGKLWPKLFEIELVPLSNSSRK
ncbi:MAG: glutaminyl-peptide cyclotransferase [Armatimonadota bacterium]